MLAMGLGAPSEGCPYPFSCRDDRVGVRLGRWAARHRLRASGTGVTAAFIQPVPGRAGR